MPRSYFLGFVSFLKASLRPRMGSGGAAVTEAQLENFAKATD
jgi:hypothetical protein